MMYRHKIFDNVRNNRDILKEDAANQELRNHRDPVLIDNLPVFEQLDPHTFSELLPSSPEMTGNDNGYLQNELNQGTLSFMEKKSKVKC